MGQLNILFALSNLFMIRKQLMPIAIHVWTRDICASWPQLSAKNHKSNKVG
jgi:hypothetical protein